jgi:hypothetical protein
MKYFTRKRSLSLNMRLSKVESLILTLKKQKRLKSQRRTFSLAQEEAKCMIFPLMILLEREKSNQSQLRFIFKKKYLGMRRR